MGTKITRYPNMKILPNDGVKFKCKCGCEFVAFGKEVKKYNELVNVVYKKYYDLTYKIGQNFIGGAPR